MSYAAYSNDDIIKCSEEVKSMAELLRKLGLKPAGGNYRTVRKKLQELNLTCDHWTGQGWSKDQQLKDWQSYARSHGIKKHLIKERGRCCELCRLSIWREVDIPLELHHIDGDCTNNDPVNLQLLCPNCHALTDNWRGKNSRRPRKKKVVNCIDCGNECYRTSKRCRSCADKIRCDTYNWPDDKCPNDFCERFPNYNKSQLARHYGVSRTTIRNWERKYIK